ncbi:MAG TPA: hypothetical protein VFP64_19235 [Pyrinomonadaceae bacterium]|nr:hypothetical protein [Pyrinomonadaceae bacterium]
MSGLADTAKAFATYSLVPYLGIVFCPGAVLLGTVGVVRSYRTDQPARGVCYVSLIVGVVVLAVQLLLWWILYQVPVWANQL